MDRQNHTSIVPRLRRCARESVYETGEVDCEKLRAIVAALPGEVRDQAVFEMACFIGHVATGCVPDEE